MNTTTKHVCLYIQVPVFYLLSSKTELMNIMICMCVSHWEFGP